MAGFRIMCDLSDFFSDVRSKAFLYIDLSKVLLIQDLIGRIQDTFNLNFFISLSVNGSYLPGSEDIRVLHDNDEIKVFKTELISTLPCWAPDQTIGNVIDGVSMGESAGTPVKKRTRRSRKLNRKRETVEHTDNLPPDEKITCVASINVKKVTKDTTSNQHKNKLEKYEVQSSAEGNDTIQQIQPQLNLPLEKKSDSVDISNDLTSQKRQICEVSPDGAIEVKNKAKRKRPRIRKRPRKSRNTDFNAVEVAANRNRYALDDSFVWEELTEKSNKTHSRFQNQSATNGSDSVLLSFNKPVETCELPASNNSCNEIIETRMAMSSEVQNEMPSTIATKANVNHSTTSYGNENHIDTFSAENNVPSQVPFDKILSLRNSVPIIVKRVRPAALTEEVVVVPALPLLEKMPTGNEVISFKVLKLDNNYCPQLSGLIRAQVIESDLVTQQLKLRVLVGLDQCQQPQGKFDMDIDCENTLSSPSDIVEFNWQELIEPFLCIDQKIVEC